MSARRGQGKVDNDKIIGWDNWGWSFKRTFRTFWRVALVSCRLTMTWPRPYALLRSEDWRKIRYLIFVIVYTRAVRTPAFLMRIMIRESARDARVGIGIGKSDLADKILFNNNNKLKEPCCRCCWRVAVAWPYPRRRALNQRLHRPRLLGRAGSAS